VSPTRPTPPIELAGSPSEVRSRLPTARVELPDAVRDELAEACATTTDDGELVEASRDWWPLAMHWALRGEVPVRAAAVCRPRSTSEVSAVLAICDAARIPVTAAAGRSGVCGASVPAHGGVVLDMTGMTGIVAIDDASLTIDVLPGTFGPDLETELRERHGLTLGHWPQSIAISTVGGWLACRSAGQYSTRYGKIEDMTAGLEVVLADGRVVHTGTGPAAAQGPDLTQLFVGSEGTLGVITSARLRVHPVPPSERRAAFGFTSLTAALDACRRILRRGATPAVLRLYDEVESQRSHRTDGTSCVLLVLDEGEPAIVDAGMAIVEEECATAAPLGDELVAGWLDHRNDVSALEALTRKGYVVDTMEIAAPWSALPRVYAATTSALLDVPHTLVATAHLSHSYLDGACLYFTFAATPPAAEVESTYVALWDAGQRAVLASGGNLSHHHGIGLNRSRFAAEALGPAHQILAEVKAALDPNGILNPGKLGLPSPFGEVGWPG
jgi:alkyldihydroxyacetonephosphate synthase